jgi:hypothetical protein
MKYFILTLLLAFTITCNAKPVVKATPKPTPNAEVVQLKRELITADQIIEAIKQDVLDTKAAFTGIQEEKDKLQVNLDLTTSELKAQKTAIVEVTEKSNKLQAEFDKSLKDITILKNTIAEKDATIEKKDITISHHKTFARQCGLVAAVIIGLLLLVIGFQFGGLLPPPYSSYLIPIVLAGASIGGYMVYTIITVYASKIA